jgi:hypothetical protein
MGTCISREKPVILGKKTGHLEAKAENLSRKKA